MKPQHRRSTISRPPELMRAFFARSDYLDHMILMILRPLSHVTMRWEATWDTDRYEREVGSFAGEPLILGA